MSKQNKKAGVTLWSVLTVLCAILTVAAIIGTNVALASAQAINIFLNTETYKLVESTDTDEDTEYFKSAYSSIEELKAAGQQVAEQVHAEGVVLLKNDNNTLPLSTGIKVTALSRSSVDIITCGTGSADIDTSDAPTLMEALESRGITVNPTVWDFYATGAGSRENGYGRTPGKGANASGSSIPREQFVVGEVPVSVYTDTEIGSFATYGDAAIVVISRVGGECYDLPSTEFTDGYDFLKLTPDEEDLLKLANEHFDKVIVLLNSTNAMSCGFLEDPELGVDACLWIGYTGGWGLNGVADILVGNANPSGSLVDTYCYDNLSAPSTVGLYGQTYTNYDAEDTTKWYNAMNGVIDGNFSYITYREGIYVGYRYYETRYEDVVLGTNTGAYDYATTVQFPFGYGLSYTTFAYSDFNVAYDAASDSFAVSVTVTNTGAVAGKEPVQIYFQSPYTDYDKTNKIEKASVELCGIAKTQVLEPGASETVTVTVAREDLTSYDEHGAGTYILDAGDYYFTAATDAHDAVNNVLAAKGYTVADGMTADGNVSLTYKYTVDDLDTETYAFSSVTGYAITNQFEDADLTQYGYDVTYLSRSDWEGTWPTVMELAATDAMFANGLYPYQTYTGIEGSTTEMPTMGASGSMTLAMMIGKDYDDPAWEDLLDQVTFDEMAVLIGQGYHNTAAIPSVGKAATLDDNGPQGFTQALTGVTTCITAYSDENIMAATFNTELMEDLGECLGEDCMAQGASGLYGPAMNTHRNAYAGRNFEYYSEDPFLAGTIAAAEVKGIQSKGVYTYIKHFALNDNETTCRCISTWANEQAIREIYLEPFRKAVVEGGAKAVMNSFARVGTVWSGSHYGMQTEVLRNEWGFEGFDLTDFSGNALFATYGITMKSFDVAWGLLAGSDSWDASATQWTEDLQNLYRNDADICQAMRQATHRILYVVANSNAMNGISSSTKIVSVTPWWQTALYVLIGVCAVGTVFCGYKLVVSIRKNKASSK